MGDPVDHDVVIAGGGPVGLMLAAELGLAGIRVLVIERLTGIDPTVKAGSITVPTAQALYRRGLLPALEAQQRKAFEQMKAFLRAPPQGGSAQTAMPKLVGHFAGIMVSADHVDLSDPVFRDAGPAARVVLVGQQVIEAVLGEHAAALGVELWRGVEVTGLEAGEDGVTVDCGGRSVRAAWLVGCDGGRSLVRRLAGFEFPGTEPALTGRQALVELEGAEGLKPGWNRTDHGIYVHGPVPGRILTVEFDGPPADRDSPVTAAEVEASLRRTSGVPVNVTALKSATRFTDNARQATTYRKGRVLLAGDAAHVHSPFGGQGLNLGIGDAANLGWKLAATIQGWAPEGLLESYTRERHPIGAWVLEWSRAQTALMRSDPRTRALLGVVGDLLKTPDGATYLAKHLSGVLHRTEVDEAHPLIGAAAPDLELADGSRLGEHGRHGKALLLDLADSAELRTLAAGWGDRVHCLTAKSASGASLSGLLVRPDGYVAWACDTGGVDGLEQALTRWFGARNTGAGAQTSRAEPVQRRPA